MNFKLLVLKILISLLVMSGNVFAKAVPPGSGQGDVPANILILLDKSGSMGARLSGGTGISYPEGMAIDSSGDLYGAQYYTYGIRKYKYTDGKLDATFGNKGTFKGTGWSGNCPVYYPKTLKVYNGYLYFNSYYARKISKLNLSTNVCSSVKSTGSYPSAFDIKNDILYSIDRSNLIVRNLSTNTDITCSYSGDLQTNSRYAYAMAIDHSGSNMYVKYSSYTYRYVIDSTTKCPSTSYAAKITDSSGSRSYGMEAHPTDDTVLYISDNWGHKIHKTTLNAAKTSVASRISKGRCCTGNSTASTVRMYSPRGMAIDAANNRVGVVEYYGEKIKLFDLNLTYIKETGGTRSTRMTGAHEAIKAIVTDSSLTSAVDFGFGYWAWGGSPGFKSWSGDITNGTANPCNNTACIKVRAHKGGAARINTIVSTVSPGGGTNAKDWATQAKEYYLHSTLSPVDKNLSCQNSYVLVIGDGQWSYHNDAQKIVTSLRQQHGIKTFTVAYGGSVVGSGLTNFKKMAQAGGTGDVIVANNSAALKAQLKAAISQIIANKLSFTAPAITATIEKSGALYQAQFDYVQNQEWQGTLTRTEINSAGVIDTKSSKNWNAAELLNQRAISSRKIWTALPGVDYRNSNYNNFVSSNWSALNSNLFQLTNNEVQEYHSKTTSTAAGSARPQNTTRCANSSGVADGNEDDIKGLINFIRGEDYFDYDADCNLSEKRKSVMGDIYHSELVVVGKPSAETSFVSTNQEAYWRSIKGYDAWAKSNENRNEMIYVGANDGMLHAFSTEKGKEEWAFAPPLLAHTYPLMVNQNLNKAGIGGSNAIFGVDGSMVVHDMYFKSALDNSEKWHTILFVPYGRGGAGFSVLDITNPIKPLHLYSVYNDKVLHKVHVMDHNSSISSFDYIATSYSISSLDEAVQVQDNAENNTGAETCDDTGNNQCFKSKTWTFPVNGLSKSDLKVIHNGKITTNFTVKNNSNGQTQITFGSEMTYYGYNPCSGSGSCSSSSSDLGIYIKSTSKATGVTTAPHYDYSKLGETWSAPRIFRLPTNGRTDTNLADDRYVAVMGGGYGTQFEGVGNALFVVDLEDNITPGSVEKVIDIEDSVESNIVNSTPGTPVVVTPDTTRGLNFRGALVYLNDFEGKITKFNLTNMALDSSDVNTAKRIDLYDNTTLFWAESTKQNGRYMYHSMDAAIGQTTNNLWLYAGTGDYERIADNTKGVENILLGIKDKHYPFYKDVDGTMQPTPTTFMSDLDDCKDTTKDSTGASCPKKADIGWYVKLKDYRKVTAEPTVNRGLVYFPIYKPSPSVNRCSLGDAMICGLDDECGTNVSSQLGKNTGSQKTYACKYVGQGVLSKIIVYQDKIFANIAGQADCDSITDAKKKDECEKKKDLIQIDAAGGDVSVYRSSWRHNY